jgi:hypothetical protein
MKAARVDFPRAAFLKGRFFLIKKYINCYLKSINK